MPAKPKRKQKPEDMLLRIIQVAEILAKGESRSPEPATVRDQSTIRTTEHPSIAVQKTQM